MKNYPSNITRQQFELIRPALENFRKRTKPRKYDLYEVFCAVLYVLKTSCQWRQVPGDFPEWRSVYNYYKIWSTKAEPTADSLLEQVFKKIVIARRTYQGRSALTSFIIVDALSVKNTATAENKGYDAGKKISGIKRHLAVDINGFPQAMHLRQVQNVLVDGGYSGVNFQLDVASNLNATVQVAKRNELHRFEVMPQRWVVERSFSWLENCRRLWKNCERQLTTSLQMVVLAFLALLLKRF
ncbi:IS5 family transposase [Lactiplantibacillus plantarum]|uniref:IS5 family transposase n=1 Tax=Lactiplantibacillus plantarum TaxID=1590 RepID=UPI0011874B57|nr:IS5 family transposase [Lactiplantibacillus plantarum]